MKPHLDIKHEGTVGSENRTRMTFDEDSITHLMSILTDLYSDPELAVIREYATNALDSHIAAGNPAPIEVELPVSLNPIYIVRDFGTGLSTDEIVNHLSKYGWSSKRGTDAEAGMLGLGFKAALTYTSQFTVVAVKNGIQTVVLVTREESGAGVVQVMDTCATDAPNGVEVRVPVKFPEKFNDRARFFFQFWRPGLVLIDGEEPEYVTGKKLDDDIILIQDNSIPHDTIVMGNIAYPCNKALYEWSQYSSSRTKVVAWVPIGTVDFTPNREMLHYTKRTEEVIGDIRQYVKHSIQREAQADIDSAASFAEALDKAQSWRSMIYGGGEFKYRGRDIPTTFFFPPDRTFTWSLSSHTETASTRLAGTATVKAAQSALHVYNHKMRGTSQITKLKVVEWCYENGVLDRAKPYVHPKPTVFFYPGDPVGLPWLENTTMVDYAEIQAVKLPSHKEPEKKTRAKYAAIDHYGNIYYVNEIKTPHLLWFESSYRHGRESLLRVAEEYLGQGKVTILSVPPSREAKFKQEHPNAVHVGTWVKRALKAFVEDMTDVERWLWTTSMDSGAIEQVRTWINDRRELPKVLDSEYRAIVGLLNESRYGRTKSAWRMLVSIKSQFARRGVLPVVTARTDFGRRIAALIANYPLIATPTYPAVYGMTRSTDHDRVEYLNAMYIARTQVHLNPITY